MSTEAIAVPTPPTAAPKTATRQDAWGDLWGAVAAMLVAFPSSIAFGVVIFTAVSPGLASSGALAGIIGAAALGMIAPLVGRNGGFITAPCAPAAAVMSGFAAQLAARGGEFTTARILAILALTALVSGLLQIVYGALRAGQLIKYIPYQVVSGYMSGVAVIIAFAQLPKLLGAGHGHSLWNALTSPHLWKWQGIIVGVVTIAAMALAPRFIKAVPGAIIGLASGIVSYFVVAIFRPELRLLEGNPLIIGPIRASGSWIGAVSQRASSLTSISASEIGLVLGPALTLSVLLSIDTLKTGVVLDALTRQRHKSNRELMAQGVANLGSFLGGGIPGAGTMGPTLVNVTSGGRTLWSGVGEGALILIALLVLVKAMAWVPIAALAGILLVIAWRMFDFDMFKLLVLPSTRLDFVVIAAVVVVAETVGLIEASLVGVCLAILLFIRNQIRGSVIIRRLTLKEMRSKRRRSEEAMGLLEKHGELGLLVQLKDDLFFGTTDQLFTELEQDLAARRFILFDFRRVQSMDYTAAHLFEQMQTRLRERNGQLLFTGMPSKTENRQDIEHYMVQLRLLGPNSHIQVFETRDSALEWMEERILESAGWVAHESEPSLSLRDVGLMNHLDDETVDQLAASVRATAVPKGAKVFAAGDLGDEIFFVRRGRISILLPLEGGRKHHLATLCRGEYFGEMAFIDKGIRSAEAEAVVDSDLFVMSRKVFDQVVRVKAPIATEVFHQLAREIAGRLRVADAELRALEER